jgi:hypothetical protein
MPRRRKVKPLNATAHQHPGVIALAEAAAGTTPDPVVHGHVADCVSCALRMDRLRRTDPTTAPPGADTVARVLQASVPPAAHARTFTGTPRGGLPQPGQLWRIGTDEAVLVWVRQVQDGTAEVMPAVLDTDLATRRP